MLDVIADCVAEDVENDLANDKEEDAKSNITKWPAVFKSSNNEDDLADDIDKEEDGVDNVGDDEDANRVLGAQTCPVLKSEQRHCTANDEHEQSAESQEPDGKGGAVLIQLKSDEAVDQETGTECRDKTILDGSEVGIWRRAWCSDSGV